MNFYIGLLSGTSVDAVDAALIDFNKSTPSIIHSLTLAIPEKIKDAVFNLAVSGDNEIKKMQHLDQAFAYLFSKATQALCKEASVSPNQVKAIGSHGQTIRHYPPSSNTTLAYSLQIGDPNIIAEETGISTVADFRRRDIAAGGHGAPLTPAFHSALLHSNSNDRIILNMGGIANITYLPTKGQIIGFDTGPANSLMDSWCQQQTGKPFDKGGHWASSGQINQALLNQLLKNPFFSEKPPKSTGRERFNLPWLQAELQVFKETLAPEDVQATLLELTAESITISIDVIDESNSADIYTCGGGSHNTFLINRLREKLSPRKLGSTEALGIHPDWVEAIAFAWFAKQTMERKPSNSPSTTGAKKRVILGGIYLGRNDER